MRIRGRRVPTGGALAVAAGAGAAFAAAQWVPSVVSLGQWLPVRALPWCTWRGPARPAVALTFDDGPVAGQTPAVLDRLDDLGVPATFFFVGRLVERDPAVVRAVVDAGHEIGTHGYDHVHHLGRGPRWVRDDLARSIASLEAAGVRPRWFRPPFGQASGPTLLEARRQGVQVALWSAWGREWAAPDSAAVASRVTAALAPGAVVLLHDTDAYSPPGSASKALDALASIVDRGRQQDLSFVTLGELVAA